MKATVLSLTGQKTKEITLPPVFETEVNTGLIKRAVLAIQSSRLQPKGVFPKAGRQNTAVYVGYRGLPAPERTINIGHARLPRMKNRRTLAAGQVARVPQAVGGVRAHPPKVEKNLKECINKKEKKKALQSAIAATTQLERVKKRGHQVAKEIQLPLIIEKGFEEIEKTSAVIKTLKAIHVFRDIENAKKKKRIRAGKGKRRGRKFKRKKSILIVTSKNAKVYKAARNLEGVDIVSVQNLNAELLAPGAVSGRLTVWTEGSIQGLEKKKSG
ncbi:50S ribosomal protein L4 [Candidatus Micrarchaeota archaeon]|nr:50S ribosomal protein L4 [Candidatus Micrarchaeota archaeon]MBU1930730.1 50S ribosomal protein L4 [Candidatus Micrarchaeota archaeon]